MLPALRARDHPLVDAERKSQLKQASDPVSEAVSTRLKWTVAATVFLLAAAMGLKAWDEHQRADQNLLLTLQAEAEALAGRVTGRDRPSRARRQAWMR